MSSVKWLIMMGMIGLTLPIAADAEEIGCVSTTWRLWAEASRPCQ